jgi:hypothetical protein
MNRLRSFHRTFGLFVLAVFLASGAYMKFAAHPDKLADGGHMMFVSRHIYILANALIHLVLAAYIAPLATGVRHKLQWTASSLLAGSSLLLITAFVVEPIAGRARTPFSTFGLYLLFAGAILHFEIATRAQRIK